MNKLLMDYLGKAEGLEIHRNETESDITTMYGIYRKGHGYAEIFKHIDDIANKLGIYVDSEFWSKAEIDKINDYIDTNNLHDKFRQLASDFYDKYTEKLHINKYPTQCIVSIFSMYTNSPKLAIKSVQSSLNQMVKQDMIDYIIQPVDGFAGNKTFNGLEKVKQIANSDQYFGYLFEQKMLLNMSRYYAQLVVANPNKYIKYLNGWNNRLVHLSIID